MRESFPQSSGSPAAVAVGLHVLLQRLPVRPAPHGDDVL